MLVKWCSGYSYLPLRSFAKPYDAQSENIKKVLNIKFLNKKDGAGPLYSFIPAAASVDHLTFDVEEMKKIVR